MKRLLQTLLGISLLAAIASADTDSFTFKNNTGQDANDLHIEWSRGVKVTKNDKFGKYTDTEKSRSDFSKGEVKNGDSCEVTVTYDGTDPKVKSFYWTKDGKNIGNGSLKNDMSGVSMSSTDGLTTVTLSTAAGTIRTYLPQDIRAGDTISGTVIMTPDPTNQNPGSTLTGTVVELGNSKHNSKNTTLIAGIGAVALTQLIFRDSGGNKIGSCEIPIGNSNLPPIDPSKIIIGQSGHPLTVPFNGDPSKPITASVGNTQVPVLAGTPRNLVLGTPNGVTGLVDININCDGETTDLKAGMINLKLSAPKTTLMKGEQTQLHVEVSGLQGLPESAFPIPIRIENTTPSIVRIADSTDPTVVYLQFNRADMNANGVAEKVVMLQSEMTGAFLLNGSVEKGKCGATRTILKIEKLAKGGNEKDGYTVIVRRDTWIGTCRLDKGHGGSHTYSWKKDKGGEDEVSTFKTKKERDDFYKSMEEAKAKIEAEMK
ncbi:MAG: hypothetical protein KF784_06680 [Fimbriimonadaceae bacterium]|nr:hypothetical protein [Fimbriimonadaceae bacterium]